MVAEIGAVVNGLCQQAMKRARVDTGWTTMGQRWTRERCRGAQPAWRAARRCGRRLPRAETGRVQEPETAPTGGAAIDDGPRTTLDQPQPGPRQDPRATPRHHCLA